MLKNNKKLLLILILAIVLRFFKLGSIPPSLDWDETAHGYNAYSILKTGKDEYGYKFPLFFRSFDDYKPPLYTYLVVPSVAVFGLSDFAVRFPSALLGVLAVFFTYLMVLTLFKNKSIALMAALFLAISPWHLQFSRVAFETNSATFWSVLGTWAFLKGIKKSKVKLMLWLCLASLAFGANLFMYHNARVFIPLYSAMLIILFRKHLFKNIKYLLLPGFIALLYLFLLFPILTSISGQLRYKGTTIFADLSPQYRASELIKQDDEIGQSIIGKIIHNRRLIYIPILFDNYISHLRPTYLFLTADMDRHHAPYVGLLYLWDIPFIISGIYFLLKNNWEKSTKIIVFWWFLLSPVASSVTWGVPHSLRSEIYLPTFQIFAATGWYTFYKQFKRKRLYAFITSSLLFINFLFYLHQYYLHMPKDYSQAWLYGRKEAALFSESIRNNYDRVIVSTKIEQPHEFWLYYLKYEPSKYLDEGGTVSGGFLEDRNHFSTYFFKQIDYRHQQKESKTLFVGVPEDFPSDANIIKKIYYLNSEPAIYIAN